MILGRAGYGKTALCIEQIRRRMADPASRGRVIFIVPEQFSLTAEVLLALSLIHI